MKISYRITSLVLALILIVALCSCSKTENSSTSNEAASVNETKIDDIINNMSVKDKITQMFMVSFQQWKSDDEELVDVRVMNDQIEEILKKYHFGAVILFSNNLKTTEESFNLVMNMQTAATEGKGIPLMIATDQEGGNVRRLGTGTNLPGNMALSATGKKEYAYEAGSIIGSELSSLGINTALAPVVDINNNPSNPVIGIRSYGDEPDTVETFAAECVKGINESNVISCLKHFPGHGDTETDSHTGLPCINKSLSAMKENELKPYEYVIKNNAEMIMSAHILFPQVEKDKIKSEKTGKEESLPATMSDDILTGLLKKEMGFKGVVCTDAMSMEGITKKWNELQAIKLSMNAGADLICMPTKIESLDDIEKLDNIISGIEKAVKDGEISEDRINDAVRRILILKEKHGILDFDSKKYTFDKALKTVACKKNKDKEKEITDKAVTLIQNNNNILPLQTTTDSKVLVLCPYDNEPALYMLGWNRAKEQGLIDPGAEIKSAAYNDKNTDEIISQIDWADTIILGSEISSTGEIEKGSYEYACPQIFLDYAKENGKKVIAVSTLNPHEAQLYTEADAIVVVYGCAGIEDMSAEKVLEEELTTTEKSFGPNMVSGMEVILGTVKPTGKLPIDIFKLDVEKLKYTDEVLYKKGFGLTI